MPESEAGCLIAGHWGNYANERLITLAKCYGMVLTNDAQACLDEYKAGLQLAYVNSELEDWFMESLIPEIEEWMESIAPEGFTFSWEDNEYFLERTEED